MWGWSPEVLEQHQTEEDDDKMEGGRGWRKEKRGNRMIGRGGAVQTGWLRIVSLFLFVCLCLSFFTSLRLSLSGFSFCHSVLFIRPLSLCPSLFSCLAFPFLFFPLFTTVIVYLPRLPLFVSIQTSFSLLSTCLSDSFPFSSLSVFLSLPLNYVLHHPFFCLSIAFILLFVSPLSVSSSVCLIFCLPIAPLILPLLVFLTIIFVFCFSFVLSLLVFLYLFLPTSLSVFISLFWLRFCLLWPFCLSDGLCSPIFIFLKSLQQNAKTERWHTVFLLFLVSFFTISCSSAVCGTYRQQE